MKPSKVDLNSTKILSESYDWALPESEKNFKTLQKEFPKVKKEQLKEIFLYQDESYADTHFFLKTHDLKSLKRYFEANIFSQSETFSPKPTLIEEVKKEDSPEKASQTKEKFESPMKEELKHESPEKETNQNFKIKPLQDNRLTDFSKSFLLILFDFFDPMTLTKLGMTCKYFQEVSNHIQLYKKFCILLFPNRNSLPQLTPFKVLQEYIMKNPLEFKEEIRQRAVFDIRSLIWGSENYLDDYRTPSSFYKQFENWRNCYLQVPRPSLKGYYLLKEKYIKVGERDFHQTYDPVHICEYYRYLRFFENGLVIMAITSMKLPLDKLRKAFQKGLTSEEDVVVENPFNLFLNQGKAKHELKLTILRGEYMRKESKLFLKFCSKGSAVYEYELLIKSSREEKNDILIVEKKCNRELTTGFVRDDNDQRASGVKIFEFKRVNDFALDIKDLSLRSVSL